MKNDQFNYNLILDNESAPSFVSKFSFLYVLGGLIFDFALSLVIYIKIYKMTLFRLFNYGSNLFFNRLFAFIFLALLSKYLSKDTLGQYFIFMNIQTILTTLAMVGIPYLILKELPANKNYKIFNFFTYRIISLCFFLVFFISFTFFILLIFFYSEIPNLNLIFFCSLLASFNFIFYYFYHCN